MTKTTTHNDSPWCFFCGGDYSPSRDACVDCGARQFEVAEAWRKFRGEAAAQQRQLEVSMDHYGSRWWVNARLRERLLKAGRYRDYKAAVADIPKCPSFTRIVPDYLREKE